MTMQNDAGRTISLWMGTAGVPDFSPLAEVLAVDVCVVGPGIAGLTVAYHLLKADKTVPLLDDGPVATGDSGMGLTHGGTAGLLTPA